MKVLTFPRIHELNLFGYEDLYMALESNIVEATGNLREVLAYVPGEHEGDSYHWLVRLDNYNLAYLYGGCDYTGWDCRSEMNIIEMKKFNPLLLPAYDNSNRPIRDLIAFQYQYFYNLGHPEQVVHKLVYELPSNRETVFKEARSLLKHLGLEVHDDALIYG